MTRGNLRIMMTADAVGGVWVYAGELARALCHSGHRVLLVLMGPAPRPDQVAALHDIDGLTVNTTDLALEWLDPEGANIEHAREQLLRMAGAFAPDIVHLNSFREASFDWPAPVLIVAHSCVLTWWQACRGSAPDEARWQIYLRNVAAGLAAADAWAAPTAAFRDDIISAYRLKREGHIIRNGVDLALGPSPAKEAFILAAGRLWDEAKNLKTLLACAPALPWPVHVAGPIESPEQTSPPSSLDRIAWLGALPRAALVEQMRRASVFVAPALYEPFGLTILEAAACGCALVLADMPSLRELWGGAAIFADPRDTGAITAALGGICANEDLRSSLQTRAHDRARHYSRRAMLRTYAQLYQEMTVSSDRVMRRDHADLELRA